MHSRPPVDFTSKSSPLTCQVIDWHSEDTEDFERDADEAPESVDRRYMITAFGCTAEGNSVSMRIGGFCPYFYVEIPDFWNKSHVAKLATVIKRVMSKSAQEAVKSAKIVKRKKMAGFNNYKVFKFVEFSFYTRRAMQGFLRQVEKPVTLPGDQTRYTLKIWESNIDPLLRFFHDRDLEPGGWITVAKYEVPDFNRTLCQISIDTVASNVERVDIQSVAPVLIASYDIEAGSSHGDFPVAKKTYRKLAVDLVAYFFAARMDKVKKGGLTSRDCSIRQALGLAFRTDDAVHEISRMYPVKPPTSAQLDSVNRSISGETLMVELTSLKKQKAEKAAREASATLHEDETFNNGIERLMQRLVDILDQSLPSLSGDPVIQIGTTFTKYGDPGFSYKHLISLGTCDPIPGVEVIECKTERQVLLEWTKLIQVTDPDIITGWNEFGFDNRFVFDRAGELGIAERFGKLGRIKNLSGELEEKRLSSSALGDNIYYILPTRGRVMIDLMKAVQNNPSYKLESYSLDSVSSNFMRGGVSETKCLDNGNGEGMRIFTKSTKGLLEGGYVTFVVNDGIIENPHADGQKFMISGVTATSFDISLNVDFSNDYKYQWCENKDDISVKQIFACVSGSATDRALVAKYCVQDCALVGRLFEKLDILTNNLAMANVCCVPFSYLFLRGQGVKVLSLVARQTRKDGYLLPVIRKKIVDDDADEEVQEGYEGAIVLQPQADIHYDPVAVSDFSSLVGLLRGFSFSF